MIAQGFLGNLEEERDLGTTVMQKTHNAWIDGHYNDNKAVLLLRNPVDMIVAYRNFNFVGKTNRALPQRFEGYLWHLHVVRALGFWVIHATSWMCRPLRLGLDKLNLHVAHYEDILDQPRKGSFRSKEVNN